MPPQGPFPDVGPDQTLTDQAQFQPDGAGLANLHALGADAVGGLAAKGVADNATIEPPPTVTQDGKTGQWTFKGVGPRQFASIQEAIALGHQTKDFVNSGMAQHLTRLAALGQQTQDVLERAAQANLQKADVLQQHPIIAQLGRTLSYAAQNYAQRGSRATPLLNAIGAYGADFFKDTPEGLIQKAAMQRYQQMQAEGETLSALQKQEQFQTEQGRVAATAAHQVRADLIDVRRQWLDRAAKEQVNPQMADQIKAEYVQFGGNPKDAENFAASTVGISQEARRIRIAEETAKTAAEEKKAKERRDEFNASQAALERRSLRTAGIMMAGIAARTGASTSGNASDIADAIIRGEQPPDLTNLRRADVGQVRAEMARRGFDLSRAQTDWKAYQAHIRSKNAPPMLRQQQAVDFAYHSIPITEDLFNKWQELAPQSGIKSLNKLTLAAAKNAPGELGATAQALEAQVTDIVAELSQVYMGGNTPTDRAMKLASENLKSNWNKETFTRALDVLRRNLEIRRNTLNNIAPVGVSPDSPYLPKQERLPDDAVRQLKEGVPTHFRNGQVWTLQGNRPTRLQ